MRFEAEMSKKAVFLYIITGVLAGVFIVWVISFSSSKTSETSFCLICHEMKYTMKELENSKHWKNRSGYMTQCSDCHISPGVAGMVEAKWRGMEKVKIHFLEKPFLDEGKWADRRKYLKGKVQDEMPQINCTRCHDIDNMQPSSREAEKAHKTITSQMRCLDCHSIEGLEYLIHNSQR